MTSNLKIRWLYKPLVWFFCLIPVFWLAWLIFNKDLTPNPAEFTIRYLGEWAIRMLWISLFMTPVALITGWKSAVRFRRLLGLFAFFYVVLHVISYIAVDQSFDWLAIYTDICKRLYITIGLASFFILTILATTSPGAVAKRLSNKIWKTVHKGVYIAGILAVIHFFMMRKGFQIEPLIYAGLLIALLGTRLVFYLKKQL